MIPPNLIFSNLHKSHSHNHIKLIFLSAPTQGLFIPEDGYISVLDG